VGDVTYESVTGPRSVQLSDVVGIGHDAFCEQFGLPAPVKTVTLAGQVIDGGVLSTKNAVNVQVAVFPARSVAVKVIGILLIEAAMIVLGSGLCVIVTVPEQLSVAVALPVRLPRVLVQLAPLKKVIFGPQVITGGVLSITVTICVQVELLPERSVAVHITVAGPSGKAGGALLVITIEPAAVQLSVAVAVPIPPT
jgi:hypothetical protein